MEEKLLFVDHLRRSKHNLLEWKRKKTLSIKRALNSKRINNVKLVAVAKNESMYLPEWIFHHLYFGFSEIEIFYNGCNDNTVELVKLLDGLPVSFKNCDDIFEANFHAPQIQVYKNSLETVSSSFDAIMFLDIDEFWVPTDLKSSISDICNKLGTFDTVSFQWFNKLEKNSEFEQALTRYVSVEPAKQIKTLYKSYVKPKKMNPHNTLDMDFIQVFEDGTQLKCTNKQNSEIDGSPKPINSYILHRKERSQYEYIAMLLRGRPLGNRSIDGPRLKSNRRGFKNRSQPISFELESSAFKIYTCYIEEKLGSEEFKQYFDKARSHLDKRYLQVLQIVRDEYSSSKKELDRLLFGVTLPDILDITKS